jgi:Cu+-exporting ATPase
MSEQAVKDPVCGMSVDPHTAERRSRHAGKTWYFCSTRCQTKFDESPDKYLGDEQEPAEPVAPGTMYTCPMHPEIRQQGPGDCPICGMGLEPEQVSLEDGPSAELTDMTRRFWIGLFLALPVFLLGNARCCLVWLAIFCSRLEIGSQPQSEYVHVDLHWYRRCVDL